MNYHQKRDSENGYIINMMVGILLRRDYIALRETTDKRAENIED
jgi:hypothetical protein